MNEIKPLVDRLEAARRDSALVASVPRVVAAAFGALPLSMKGDTLEVAVAESASPRAIAALPRILRRPVLALPFADALVHVYRKRMYPDDDGLNFHTFLEEDFLERPENDAFLREEKPYEPVKPHVRPDPERVVLLDYSYRSTLCALDEAPTPSPFQPGDLELPFAIDTSEPDPRARYHRKEELPRSVLVLAAESYSCAGLEHSNGWRTHEVRDLPFMIHPSEIQVTGIEANGTLHFFLYDRVARVRPGEPLGYDVHYHFMNLGKRLRRDLRLQVRSITSVARDRLERTEATLPWTPRHLERWLGNDLSS